MCLLRKTKMATLKEEALAYEPQAQTKNIAELEYFSADVEVKTEEHTDKEGKPFKIKYVEVDGMKYRVPLVVLGDMKAILTRLPNTKFFTVIKTGEGMATKYQTLPSNGNEEKVN
jgi:hypothetical protein